MGKITASSKAQYLARKQALKAKQNPLAPAVEVTSDYQSTGAYPQPVRVYQREHDKALRVNKAVRKAAREDKTPDEIERGHSVNAKPCKRKYHA